MTWSWLINLTGLLCGLLLFWRRARLPEKPDDKPTVTVIIPARNEAANLPILLASLMRQTRQPDEIICVDDHSSDRTAEIARSFGVRVISLTHKPADWQGKSWACQQGADQAGGELLLFLDADVKLEPDAIGRLLAARRESLGVVSVLPDHQVSRLYEYVSVFFNLVQIAANGLRLPFKTRHAGLYGPVILIGRQEYITIEGHCAIRRSVVDDVALGRVLTSRGMGIHLYAGDPVISYRMYSGGFRQLTQGWIKNFAAGASQTPPLLLIMTSFWVTGCLGVVIEVIRLLALAEYGQLIPVVALYLLFTLQVIRAARQAGNYKAARMAFYPIWLIAFLLIFLISIVFKMLGLKVVWKGRKIDPCN